MLYPHFWRRQSTKKNAKKSPLLHSPSTFPTFQPFQAAFNDIPSKASTPKASPSGGWTWKPQHESYLSFRGCCYALISVYNIIQLYIICGCRMTRWYHMVIIFSMYVYIYMYMYIYNMCVWYSVDIIVWKYDWIYQYEPIANMMHNSNKGLVMAS